MTAKGQANILERVAKPPSHLRRESKAWWRQCVQRWILDESDLQLLRLACEALDRAAEARELLAAEGMVIAGRQGPKPHPAAAIERQAMITYARLLRELQFTSASLESRIPRQ